MTDEEPVESIRPEVVEAIVAALTKFEVGELMPLMATGITPAEQKRADELVLSMMLADSDRRTRSVDVWSVIIKRQWPSTPSWDQIWGELDDADLERLRGEFYDVLPDGLRRLLDAHDAEEPPGS